MNLEPVNRQRLAEALLWIIPAVWSSNYLIARAAPGRVAPHVLAFGRWALVLLVLLTAFGSGRSLWRRRALLAREGWQTFVLGALGMWICGAWVYLGGQSTSATNIALIYAAAPIGIALGGARLLGEPLAPRQWAAMGMALAGVLIVVVRGDPRVLAGLRLSAGDLWALAAMLGWVAYSLLLRRWPTALTATERLAATSACGLACLAPFAVVETLRGGWPQPQGWALIGVAALLPGLISYLAYAFMQQMLGVARSVLLLYLAPVYAALLAWALLGEQPRWYHLAGAALILPAIRVSAARGRQG